MQEFYSIKPTKVILNKTKRNKLWNQAKNRTNDFDLEELANVCPALAHQITRSYESGYNIQSAVFSECVYAQTIANMFDLNVFANCYEDLNFIPNEVNALLDSYNLEPRYAYSTNDKSRILIQAGSCNGIDSALITVIDLTIYTIEFKEPGAKTSEPDLPKYGEDGILTLDETWLEKNSQFKKMLEEQKGLNFFEIIGHNVHDFSYESVMYAISNNYIDKLLNVICTEDANGYLVMMPANQIQLWAHIEGEIRPSGRNHYNVWTPVALKNFLLENGATINENQVTIKKSQLKTRKQRGGGGKISGYKINPLFFVYSENCSAENENITFDIKNVRQLNPTVAGKVSFKNLKHADVKKFYSM